MFQGYTQETFEFFMAIRFNNNRDFFQGNRDWYLCAVREPTLALAEALAPVIERIDEDIERRPNKVVSRINRDIRFSKDKSPYRDYIWLSYKRPSEQKSATPGFYFDVSDSGASYGMGFYGDNRPLMNALRTRLLREPEDFLNVWGPIRNEYVMYGTHFKRMAVPDDIYPELAEWYTLKSFYVAEDIRDFDLIRSGRLAYVIEKGFEKLAQFYKYLMNIMPEPDQDETKVIDPWKDFAQYI